MNRWIVVLVVCLLCCGYLNAECLLRGTQYLETVGQNAALTAADFNQDGFDDVAVAVSETKLVRVFENQGDATFQISNENKLQNRPTIIRAGDFNGDQVPDLAVAGNNGITILQRQSGKFVISRFVAISSVVAIAVGDFNSDARADLAVLTRSAPSGTITVLINANGEFQKTQTFSIKGATNLVLAPLGANKNPDLIISATDGSLTILQGSAVGAFTLLAPIKGIPGASYLLAGFVNQDAFMDLIIAGEGGNVAVLLGQSGGEFTRMQFPTASEIRGVAMGDFNHDRKTDLLLIQANTRVSIYSGNAHGAFASEHGFLLDFFNGPVLSTDLNHDGNSDFVATEPGSAGVFLGNGHNNFATGERTLAKIGGNVVAGDFDADGNEDVIISRSDGSSFLRGKGNGTFEPPVPADLPLLGYATASDLDGDGTEDIVGFDRFTLKTWLSSGEGRFREFTQTKFPVDPPIQLLDMNGDGLKDIEVVAPYCLYVLINVGGGKFAPATRISLGTWWGRLDDFNGDHIPDLATIAWKNTFVLDVYLGGPNLAFTQHQEFPLSDCAASITTGDANGDGKSDIVVGSGCKSPVQVFKGDGLGNFSSPLNARTGDGSADLTLVDMNGDGAQEIVAIAKGPAKVSISVAPDFTQYFLFGPRSWTRLAVADFNRDGEPDVVASSFDATVLFQGCK